MKLTEEQLTELVENYGLDREIIESYYEAILDRLNANNMTEYTNEEVYECLERCCDEEISNEFEKLILAGLTHNMPEDEKEKILKEVSLNRSRILSRNFDNVFEVEMLQQFMNYLENKIGEEETPKK